MYMLEKSSIVAKSENNVFKVIVHLIQRSIQ